LVLQPGDAYILRSGGGGGFGSPLEREPEKVAHDLRQGYITKESAERHYGIVFRDGKLDPDIVATQARREDMRANGLPVDDPEPPEKVDDSHSHAGHNHHQDLTEEERLVIAMSGRCCA
jgi:N-methylhydantoinase B